MAFCPEAAAELPEALRETHTHRHTHSEQKQMYFSVNCSLTDSSGTHTVVPVFPSEETGKLLVILVCLRLLDNPAFSCAAMLLFLMRR